MVGKQKYFKCGENYKLSLKPLCNKLLKTTNYFQLLFHFAIGTTVL